MLKGDNDKKQKDIETSKTYQGITPANMGCRTYICSNASGEAGTSGRGNITPVTLNLLRLGILSKRDVYKFYKLLGAKLEIARECYFE